MRRIGLAIVVAALAIPAVARASHQFDDVPDTNFFHDDIAWMFDNGVTQGCDADNFCPNDAVTREQMAAFMRRLAESQAVDAGTVLGEVPAKIVSPIWGASSGNGGDAVNFGTNAVATLQTVEFERGFDGAIDVQASMTWRSSAAVRMWATLDQVCQVAGEFSLPVNPLPGSFAQEFESGSMASGAFVELAAGFHTLRLCASTINATGVDASSITATWTVVPDV